MKKKKSRPNHIPPIQVRSPEQLGNAIRRLRKLQDLSQTELAEKAGITQAMVSRIEKGNRKAEIGTLLLVFAALGCDLHVASRIRSESTNPLDGLY